MKNMKHHQSGFTIIELVMVIVILGILSAFALPRFADFGTDAREASLAGVAGAIKSAAAISHAEQLVGNIDADDPITLEGQTITMIDGYPTADADGIQLAAGIETADFTITGGGTGGGATLRILIKTDCYVEYTAANTVSGNLVGYDVAIVSTDC